MHWDLFGGYFFKRRRMRLRGACSVDSILARVFLTAGVFDRLWFFTSVRRRFLQLMEEERCDFVRCTEEDFKGT